MFSLGIRFVTAGREFVSSSQLLAQELRSDTLRRAMEDSLQIILQSTYAGFKRQEAPDGTPWRPNATWYAEMKNNGSPNIGPVSKTIQGGPFAKTHEFESVNSKRMLQSLVKENHTTTGVIQYEEQARERASLTQFGGTSEFAIVSKSTGGRLAFDVRCVERPHLGLATYNRIGSRTDAEWVQFYFGEQVEAQLQEN